MTEERLDRIQRIYCAALERDPDARPTFLEEACAGDNALRAYLDGLRRDADVVVAEDLE